MNNNQIIPKHFYLFGEKIKVSILKEVDKGRLYGQSDINQNKIRIAKTVRRAILNEDQKEQTYIHELVHMILDHLGYSELSTNEEFVDRLAKCLHQALKTSEY